MKKPNYIIGVDVGASKIIFILMKNRSILGPTLKIKTPKNRKEFVGALVKNIEKINGSIKIKADGLGIGLPGALDPKREKVLRAPNLTYLERFDLTTALKKKIKLPVILENDANSFTLAEALLGAGKGRNIVLGITLGSGLGGGIVIGKKIFQGAFGGAGEIGHMAINLKGPGCPCGNGLGCLESYCGERFFQRKKVSSKDQFEKARNKNQSALKIFKEYGKYLGIGIANVANILEPDIIIIGGGISKAHRYFLKTAISEAKKRILSPLSRKNLNVKIGQLGKRAGAIGACLNALPRINLHH